eukprot:5505643-Amphidinium_carterae.1
MNVHCGAKASKPLQTWVNFTPDRCCLEMARVTLIKLLEPSTVVAKTPTSQLSADLSSTLCT